MESNQASTQQSVCPKCGKSVQSDFTRCPYCGAKLGASSNNLKDFKEKAKSVFQSIVRVAKAHKKATIGVVVALVVIIALIPIISAITSPFNSLKANNVSVGYQTAEEVEKQFGKPTDVLTDTYSSLPASCDEVWVYYPDSIDNQIKSINKMLENANSFADLDKADKEYQKLTEKKFKQVVIGISDDKLVFYSLNTQAMYNEEDLFATKDSKELSKCTFNKTMVCRDTTVSDNKITFTAKFTDGSIFIGKVSGYSRVDEKNPTVEFSCPWSKLSLTLNVVDHYFSNSCTCKNCGNEVHDLDNDCKCSRCNNSFHNIHGCECINCDYNTHTPDVDCVCTICHQSAHIINKINCTCSQCGESFHKLDEYYSCTRCNNYGLKYEIIDDNNCTITDCVGLSGSIAIPASYKGVPVTKIGNDAFRGCGSLTSIILPDTVTSIEKYAFSSCTSLTSITIPSSVTSIDISAFIYCSSLTRIDITDMAKWCAISFSSSSGNPLSYAYNLYLNGELVTDLVIPDSVTSIESYAFYNCTSLTSITIPDSVTSIGDSSFYGCDSLTKVDITDLAKWCAISFGNAYANPLACAENLYIKGELVTDLVIPESVTSIGDRAFFYCSSLTSVTIPDSVTSIGDSSFYGCDSLTKVDITDLAKWCAISFGNDGANPLAYAEDLYLKGELVTDLVIPDSVTYIYTAFSGCSSLTSITIPNSVTSIGAGAFSGCSNLTSITIPNSVTSIGAGAFDGCRRLTSITIPDSVTSIGERVFSGCSSLTSITIPDSVTSIGNYAFRNCSRLTNITIPDGVTSIGSDAFYNCSSLTSITIPDSVTSIGASAFSICSISRIDITSLFKWCSISFGGRNFGGISSAFDSQYDLYLNGELVTNLVIPDSVTSIGRYAFYNCISLTSITIPNSVTSIGSYAFYYCSNLKNIAIGKCVTSIGGGAFEGCKGLTSITIPNSVTSIEASAFEGCISLTSITIGNGVTSIDWHAFQGCSNLTSITIGNGVTSIGWYAFQGCSNLTSINFNGTQAQWDAISKGPEWNGNTGDYTVYCTDGTISKS